MYLYKVLNEVIENIIKFKIYIKIIIKRNIKKIEQKTFTYCGFCAKQAW